MSFDFWQRWGIQLDDASFANALAALGFAQGDHRLHHPDGALATLHWDFPDRALAERRSPQEWAHLWGDVATGMNAPVRLRIGATSPGEPILPWYRMLSEANPAPRGVSLRIDAPQPELDVGWPLRLGCISDSAWNVLEVMRQGRLWPSSKLVRPLRLDRDKSSCDVLLYRGHTRGLLRELLEMPWRIKANLVLLEGGNEAAWGELSGLLSAVLAQVRASGFILVPAGLGDAALANIINEIVRELSHAQPVDLALGESVRRGHIGDVVAGFTDEMVAFVVPDLATRYNARMSALPEGTVLDLSRVGRPDEWLARGVRASGIRGGESKRALRMPPEEDRAVEAASISIDTEELRFDHEGDGSSTIAEVAEGMASAAPPPGALEARAARFLQQRSFVRQGNAFREAEQGFLAGVPAMVRVRIAALEKGWDFLPSAFPVEALPQHLERWTLTVWLSEPDHLPEPLKRKIELPRDGDSTECEFHFQPREFPRFEGRLTVTHRGRIVQTALLRAGVATADSPSRKENAAKLEELVAVRRRLGDLDSRRAYDLALVANHDSRGRPLLTGLSDKAAWVKDLSQMPALAAEINATLSPVAKSVKDYAKGLGSEKGRALLVQLAHHGEFVRMFLSQALDAPGNSPATAEAEFVQIVSTRADAVVPLEFVYDYPVPREDAKVCEHWRDALDKGKCPTTCGRESGSIVCPMGFWGVRKVIERHAVTPALANDGNVLYLQSEPTRERETLYLGGAAVLGASNRVLKPSIAKLKKTLKQHSGAEPRVAKDWTQWEKLVVQHHPALLVALPHTDGKRTNVTVEIGNAAVPTVTLRATHVFPPPLEGRQAPVVAFIGCDTAGTADDYGYHVMILRDRGAGIVIGTIATVFGDHAASVAGKLIEGMLRKDAAAPVRLGELMREVRRASLRDNLLMPLCLVAYGDADWILSPKSGPDA